METKHFSEVNTFEKDGNTLKSVENLYEHPGGMGSVHVTYADQNGISNTIFIFGNYEDIIRHYNFKPA